jgi:hypothetical protein
MADYWTHCTPAKDHVKMSQYIQATIQALVAGAIGTLLVAAVGTWWCAGIVAVITVTMWGLGYCHWWLSNRLVCLDGDRAAVGMVVSVELPADKSWDSRLDTDFSINLLPAGNPLAKVSEAQAAVGASSPYGILVREQDSTKAAGLICNGEWATDAATGIKVAILHAEFEGAGVADFLFGLQIALGLGIVGLIVCLAGGFWGMVAGYILAFLALLAAFLAVVIGLSDTGSPGDAGIPSIETNTSKGSGSGVGADVLGVFGRWVYDAGHNNENRGWNEIHPIKTASKLATWGGDWGTLTIAGNPVKVDDLVSDWEATAAQASSPLTVEQQATPEQHWKLHPLIDGCGDDPDAIELPT